MIYKYPTYEVIDRELPCVMCLERNEDMHECSIRYGYTSCSECNVRKAERNEEE